MITAVQTGVYEVEVDSRLHVEYQLRDGRNVLATSTLRLNPSNFKSDEDIDVFVTEFLKGRERKANRGQPMHEVSRSKTVAEIATETGKTFRVHQKHGIGERVV